jgi:hypothetical protein
LLALVDEIEMKIRPKSIKLLPVECINDQDYFLALSEWFPTLSKSSSVTGFSKLNVRGKGKLIWGLRPYTPRPLILLEGVLQYLSSLVIKDSRKTISLSREMAESIKSRFEQSNREVSRYSPIGLPGYF